MGPMAVVMIDKNVQNLLKMRLVEHQEPIETFEANRSYESLRDAVGLWRAKRRTNDLDPIAAEHVVETVSEFLIPVPNQEPDRFRGFRQRPCQMAGLLRHPQANRLDREEIDREQTVRVRPYELSPRHATTPAGWSEARLPQPRAHRR